MFKDTVIYKGRGNKIYIALASVLLLALLLCLRTCHLSGEEEINIPGKSKKLGEAISHIIQGKVLFFMQHLLNDKHKNIFLVSDFSSQGIFAQITMATNPLAMTNLLSLHWAKEFVLPKILGEAFTIDIGRTFAQEKNSFESQKLSEEKDNAIPLLVKDPSSEGILVKTKPETSLLPTLTLPRPLLEMLSGGIKRIFTLTTPATAPSSRVTPSTLWSAVTVGLGKIAGFFHGHAFSSPSSTPAPLSHRGLSSSGGSFAPATSRSHGRALSVPVTSSSHGGSFTPPPPRHVVHPARIHHTALQRETLTHQAGVQPYSPQERMRNHRRQGIPATPLQTGATLHPQGSPKTGGPRPQAEGVVDSAPPLGNKPMMRRHLNGPVDINDDLDRAQRSVPPWLEVLDLKIGGGSPQSQQNRSLVGKVQKLTQFLLEETAKLINTINPINLEAPQRSPSPWLELLDFTIGGGSPKTPNQLRFTDKLQKLARVLLGQAIPLLNVPGNLNGPQRSPSPWLELLDLEMREGSSPLNPSRLSMNQQKLEEMIIDYIQSSLHNRTNHGAPPENPSDLAQAARKLAKDLEDLLLLQLMENSNNENPLLIMQQLGLQGQPFTYVGSSSHNNRNQQSVPEQAENLIQIANNLIKALQNIMVTNPDPTVRKIVQKATPLLEGTVSHLQRVKGPGPVQVSNNNNILQGVETLLQAFRGLLTNLKDNNDDKERNSQRREIVKKLSTFNFNSLSPLTNDKKIKDLTKSVESVEKALTTLTKAAAKGGELKTESSKLMEALTNLRKTGDQVKKTNPGLTNPIQVQLKQVGKGVRRILTKTLLRKDSIKTPEQKKTVDELVNFFNEKIQDQTPRRNLKRRTPLRGAPLINQN